jgi:DAK2 domain fusion protein YloV
MEVPGPGAGIQLAVVLRFVDIAASALEDAREEIDALNVYPVPDGDTGTNMFLTVVAAREAVRRAAAVEPGEPVPDRDAVLEAFARGALLGARGNSGVILSEMLGAIVRRVADSDPAQRNAVVMAEALQAATTASYAAVQEPVEGTMLSVVKAASEAAATRAADDGARVSDVFTAAAAAAREALARTPDQLAALRDAGVVDAGGRGVSVILDAAEHVLTGRRPTPVPTPIGVHSIPVPTRGVSAGDLTPGGPGYEVMYLLDAEEERVAPLRAALASLGDSLVVVGGQGLWNVHVHVDDVGAAIEAGITAGRPHRIRVTHFADQIDHARGAHPSTPRTGRAVVAVAAGPGLRALFEQAGAHVVDGGPGRRPSTGELLEAVIASGAAEVLVLPNDADSLRTAQLAASSAESESGITVAVIPTRAQVQGLAAMAVHEPGRSFDQDVLEMTATARQTRQGAITVAARRAMTMAGPCEPGDVLGVIGGDFAVVGQDRLAVATSVLDRLLGGGGELATIVSGADDEGGGLARACADWLEAHHPVVDVVVYDGGQDRYPLLVSVE